MIRNRNQDEAIERLATDFGAYRVVAERQQQDLRSHFEKLEAQMQTLIETSKIRNEDQARTQERHEAQMKEIKDLVLDLDKGQSAAREKLDQRIGAIEGNWRDMEGSLRVWKMIGSGAAVLLLGAISYLFFFAWQNDRGAPGAVQDRHSRSRSYEYEDRRP